MIRGPEREKMLEVQYKEWKGETESIVSGD